MLGTLLNLSPLRVIFDFYLYENTVKVLQSFIGIVIAINRMGYLIENAATQIMIWKEVYQDDQKNDRIGPGNMTEKQFRNW